MTMLGKKHSQASKNKIGVSNSVALKGRTIPNEVRAKMRATAIRIGSKPPAPSRGKDSPHWKGDDVKYHALHDWVYRVLGSPMECEHCHTTKKRVYHWANRSHKYKREIGDWIRLCVPCHRKYDSQEVA